MLRMRALLFVVSLSVCGYAWSDEPSNHKAIPNKDKKAKQEQRTTNIDTSSLEKAIRESIKEASEKSDPHADEKLQFDRELSEYTGQLADFTKWLVFVAAVQASLFVWQLKLMRKATEDAGIAAKAAETNSNALMLSERAYVKVSPSSPGIGAGIKNGTLVNYGANFEIKNYGQTPARITDLIVLSKFLKNGQSLPSEPDYKSAQKYIFPGAFLVKEDHFFYLFSDIANSQEIASVDRPNIVNVSGQYFIYGYVDYIDMFGNRHRGGFARVFEPRINIRDIYSSDDDFAGRCNLVFVDQSGYNYDRPRKENEGNDWDQNF